MPHRARGARAVAAARPLHLAAHLALTLALAACGSGSTSNDGDHDAGTPSADAAVARPDAGPFANLPDISSTLYSTFFLKEGVAYGCGSNAVGHLGVDDPFIDNFHTAIPLAFPDGTVIAQVSAGGHGGAALDDEGRVWTWGSNLTGELGIGTVDTYTPIKPEVREIDHVVQLASGYQFVGALKDDGSVWVWGLNGFDGTTAAAGVTGLPLPAGDCPWGGNATPNCYAPSPNRIAFPEGTIIRTIYASDFAMLAIDTQNQVWSWGGYAGTDGLSTNVPQKWPGLPPIRSLGAGRGSTFAVDEDGSLWTWRVSQPAAVKLTATAPFAALDGHVVAVGVSGHSVHVLDDQGQLWGWGDQQIGEVGNGPPGLDPLRRDENGCLNASYDYVSTTPVTEPVVVLTDVAFVSSSSFSYSVFAIKTDGTMWAWGRNKVFGLCNAPAPLEDCAAPVGAPDAYNVGVPTQITPFSP